MVLYESHSIIHGRPFPLKGRYYANVFIHFEPLGHSLRHNAGSSTVDVHAKYKEDSEQGRGGHEHEVSGLPPYIREHSEEAYRWIATHPKGSKVSFCFFFKKTQNEQNYTVILLPCLPYEHERSHILLNLKLVLPRLIVLLRQVICIVWKGLPWIIMTFSIKKILTDGYHFTKLHGAGTWKLSTFCTGMEQT